MVQRYWTNTLAMSLSENMTLGIEVVKAADYEKLEQEIEMYEAMKEGVEIRISDLEDTLAVAKRERDAWEEKYLTAGQIAETMRDDNTLLTHRVSDLGKALKNIVREGYHGSYGARAKEEV